MQSSFGKLVGGRLCLDFVNTVQGRTSTPGSGRARDYADRIIGERLLSYDALLQWATLTSTRTSTPTSTLTTRDARILARHATAHPAQAAAVLDRALVSRAAIYRLVKAAIEGWPADADSLATLNRELHAAREHEHLVVRPGSARSTRQSKLEWKEWKWNWEWEWDRTSSADLDRVLWPIIRDAADLLTGPDLRRIGQCPGVECGWLFLDTSRSGHRQWCDMAMCGNLAKVHRFRQRQREITPSATRQADRRASPGARESGRPRPRRA